MAYSGSVRKVCMMLAIFSVALMCASALQGLGANFQNSSNVRENSVEKATVETSEDKLDVIVKEDATQKFTENVKETFEEIEDDVEANDISPIHMDSEREGTVVNLGGITTATLRSVSYSPNGNVALICGSSGTIYKHDANTGEFKKVTSSTTKTLYKAAWHPAGQYALIVGASGTVLKYELSGDRITALPSGSTKTLYDAVFTPDGTTAYISGSYGAVLKYSSGNFEAKPSGTTKTLYSCDITSDGSTVVFVGSSGLVRTYNGRTFNTIASSTTKTLYGIAMKKGTSEGLIVGSYGVALKFRHSYSSDTITSVSSGTTKTLYGVTWVGETAVIVGSSGLICKYNGVSFTTMDAPSRSTKTVYAAALKPDGSGTGITVGSSGAIYGLRGGIASWTWMLYNALDCDLASWNIRGKIQQVGSSSKVHFIMLDDGPGVGDSNITYVKQNQLEVIKNLGEVSTGDKNVMRDFIKLCAERYPAEHYGLMISGHSVSALAGFGADDNANGGPRYLSVADVQWAMAQGGVHFDLFVAGTCVWGGAEFAYEFRNYADYMVASQEVSYGFTANTWASALKTTPSMDAVQLGKKFVDMYYSYCSGWDGGITAALYDLSKIEALVTKVDELADALNAKYSTYKADIDAARNASETIHGVEHVVLTAYTDLYDLAYNLKSKVSDSTIKAKAEAIMEAVSQVVLYEKHPSWGNNAKVHGINIFYITKTTEGGRFTPSMYHSLNIDFVTNTSWDEFVQLAY